MDFLISLLNGLLPQFWAPIAGAVGILVLAAGAYFKGKGDQAAKGKDVAQKETIDAYKDRNVIDESVRDATDTERQRLRDKWTRDN